MGLSKVMDYYDILITRPWIPYIQHFRKNYILLKYPENVIFAMQLISESLKGMKDIYHQYPDAERYDITPLTQEDWYKSDILFDNHYQMVKAPESLFKLENLMRRLKFRDAKKFILGMFPGFQLNTITCFFLVTSIFLINTLIINKNIEFFPSKTSTSLRLTRNSF